MAVTCAIEWGNKYKLFVINNQVMRNRAYLFTDNGAVSFTFYPNKYDIQRVVEFCLLLLFVLDNDRKKYKKNQ